MKNSRSFGVLFALALGALSTAAAYASAERKDDSVVVRAFFSDRDMVAKLAAERTPWQVDYHKRYLLIDAAAADIVALEAAGFRVEVDAVRTAEMRAPTVRLPNQRAGIPGFACYRTVDETLALGTQLAADYPQLATWTDVGNSWEKDNALGGTDLMVLKLTSAATGGTKPVLFQMTAIHAREYTTAELNMRFAEYLLANYGTDADATWLLDHHEIHLLLQSNPDGRRKAETGLFWRKNTNQAYCGATSNSRGADLNRNYPFLWGGANGSSGNPCASTYRGPTPASEPETQAVRDYVRSIFPDQRGPGATDAAPADATGVFLDTHSFSELVLWPWGYTNTAAPNGTALQTLGRKFASFNGYLPQQAIGLYPTDGTTDDFAYGELGIAAYTFELGTAFFQNCGTFEGTILPDNMQALLYAAKVARAPYQLPAGPDVIDLQLAATTPGAGGPLTLSATADDTRYSGRNGTEPTQNVAAAEYYIDVPYWEAGATAVALDPADGGFNSGIEDISGNVDTSGLADGRHTLFVRARDSAGNWGPVSARFIYLLDPATAPRFAGTVRAADTGAALAADIVATGAFTTSSDAGSGAYELLVPAGNYDLTATVAGDDYAATTLTGLAATTGTTTSADFLMFPRCTLFADDGENGNAGWSAGPGWVLTTETANSPSHSWTESAGGQYGNNVESSLTSPTIDLTGHSGTQLDYAQICDSEATYDFCIVEVRAAGGAWIEVARYDGNASSWSNVSVDMPALDGAASAQWRFRFSSDITITEDGWHLDDVVLRAAGPSCAGPDTDSDGIGDAFDNCSLLSNPDQRDTNADGFGNRCDPDLNDDNTIDFLDLGLIKQAFFASGDLDSDFNGDSNTDFVDLGILKSYFFQAPGPGATSTR